MVLVSSLTTAQEKWIINSEFLEKPDSILIFKPNSYTSDKFYPLVYLLHGYSEDYTQWARTINCQDLANRYNMVIVCPEGFTTYYIDSPNIKGAQFESFFFKELAPKVHREFNINNKNIFISGLSMGGYGALRYFILHPDYFNTAGSTSGAIDIDYTLFRTVSRSFWQNDRMIDDLQKSIGAPDTNDWHKYSIIYLLQNKPSFSKPFILDCGKDDLLYQSSVALKAYADKQNIPITFISQPGEHNMDYWGRSIENHFIYYKQHLK